MEVHGYLGESLRYRSTNWAQSALVVCTEGYQNSVQQKDKLRYLLPTLETAAKPNPGKSTSDREDPRSKVNKWRVRPCFIGWSVWTKENVEIGQAPLVERVRKGGVQIKWHTGDDDTGVVVGLTKTLFGLIWHVGKAAITWINQEKSYRSWRVSCHRFSVH